MLRVLVTDAAGRRAPSQRLARWLERHAPARSRGRVVIALVSDRVMRRLNHRFRGKNLPTDVLSFPSDEPGWLGELAIATGVCGRQARAQGHVIAIEQRILALHGLLHLLGYDHETDDGQMRRAEERLRRRAGLPSGLIRRATP